MIDVFSAATFRLNWGLSQGGSIRSEPKLVLFILKHLLEFLCTHWSTTFQKTN